MSDQTLNTRASPKNLYGAAKIAAHAAEKAKRRDEHEEDAIEHDRKTKTSRAKFAYWVNLKERLQNNYKKSEGRLVDLAAEQETVRREIQRQNLQMKQHESEYEGAVQAGDRDTVISAKYKAYLEMDSDELDL